MGHIHGWTLTVLYWFSFRESDLLSVSNYASLSPVAPPGGEMIVKFRVCFAIGNSNPQRIMIATWRC